MTDLELLNAYKAHHSESAFTELVNRHAGMVYASAMRQLGNPHQAEEVTQAVFILLARKAATLNSSVVVGGWLFRATQFAVNDLKKGEFRRQRRENLAYQMNTESPLPETHESDESAWDRVGPVLDSCLHNLGESDRHAILLRFFENKSLAEVGAALGIAEDAARKRVSRAVDKLRTLLMQRGTTVSDDVLSPLLSRQSRPTAPAGLMASTVAAALHSLPNAASPAATLASGVGKHLSWLQWKSWISIGAATALVTSSVTWTWIAHNPFNQSSAIVAGKTADNYQPAGFDNPDTVHKFIQGLQTEALRQNRAAIAASVRYPLRVNTTTGSSMIRTESELMASFDKIFPAQVLRVLLKCPRSGLYCDERGVMIGSGELWLAPADKAAKPQTPQIIAVNLPQ